MHSYLIIGMPIGAIETVCFHEMLFNISDL
jgi:hypothetical protein